MNSSMIPPMTPQRQTKIILLSLNWIAMNATEGSFKCFGKMQHHLWIKFEYYKRDILDFYFSLDSENTAIFEEWLLEVSRQFE
jgi:hypothetical protein